MISIYVIKLTHHPGQVREVALTATDPMPQRLPKHSGIVVEFQARSGTPELHLEE